MEDPMRISNRRVFLSTVVIAALFAAIGGCASAEKQDTPFTVVLLPDTQNYSEKYPDTYLTQTRWIKSRAKPDNVKFVIHLGDIVQTARIEKEWRVADRAHAILDGVVPYSVVPGNHDMDSKNRRLTRGTSLYDKYFPPSRFEKHSWYGGHMGESNASNYCLFEAGGMKFMVLSLAFAPSDPMLAWAGGVIHAHKDCRVIVATHFYMRPEGRGTDPRPYGLDGCNGEDLWKKFVQKYDNIFMVVSGHVLGVNHQTSINRAGRKVHEILCDYQGLPNGGDGWLLTLRFVPRQNKIHAEAYSPLLDKHNVAPMHTYTLDYDMSPVGLKKAG